MKNQKKEHWRAFGKEWFNKNQNRLLWFLNTPIIKTWFRWVMCIKEKGTIERIMPNGHTFNKRYVYNVNRDEWRVVKTTDFRTHQKYSKRLYYAFAPIWWAMHFFDWLFLDDWFPQYSFGFDTLTTYPNNHVEVDTVDGRVSYQDGGGVDWSVIHDAATGTSSSDNGTTNVIEVRCDGVTNKFDSLQRCVMLYLTSYLGSDEVSGATLSFNPFSVNDDFSDSVGITSSNPASNTALSTADYDQFGSTSFGDITLASITTLQYNPITLNASGLAAIDGDGVTKLSLRMLTDIEDSEPTWGASDSSLINSYSADRTGTAEDPKLVITHSAAVSEEDVPIQSIHAPVYP